MNKEIEKLYRRIGGHPPGGRAAERVRQKLQRLYPGDSVCERLNEYYAGLFALLLQIAAVGIFLSVAAAICFWLGESKPYTQLSRNDFGKGSNYVELLVQRQDGQSAEKRLEVEERRYTEAELQALFAQMMPVLEKQMVGENPSLSHVTCSLELPSSVEGYPFDISWHSSRPEILKRSGEIQRPLSQNGDMVELKGVFTCEDTEKSKKWNIKVYPGEQTAQETWEQKLSDALQKSDRESAYATQWKLPEKIDGMAVSWTKKRKNPVGIILSLTFAGMALTVWGREHDLNRKWKIREESLEKEYSGIVTRLTLYLGAGMTVKDAWKRTAKLAERENENNFAVKEMLLACRELDSGIYETSCYEAFGRRCGRQEYVKLGTLLSQNLKKGNRELLKILRAEVWTAQENQKHMARRKGEEASTKLLGPMMLMLGMILMLIMIPAFGNL